MYPENKRGKPIKHAVMVEQRILSRLNSSDLFSRHIAIKLLMKRGQPRITSKNDRQY